MLQARYVMHAMVQALALFMLAGCAGPRSPASPEHVAPHSAELGMPPRIPSIVVSGRSAFVGDNVSTDNVRNLSAFQRLDGLYAFLKDFPASTPDRAPG